MATKRPTKKATKVDTATSPDSDTLTTTIHIRREHWQRLRRVAFGRAEASGGRPSVSAVIGDPVDTARGKLTLDECRDAAISRHNQYNREAPGRAFSVR